MERSLNSVHFSSKTDDWYTPQEFFEALDAEFHFTLDPCSSKENAVCDKFFTIEDDGLSKSWAGERVFMNPPYGRVIGSWMKKALAESMRGALVVCLIPARTDTKWWHECCALGEVRFIKGRLKFGGSKTNAPFPSAIVIFRPQEVATEIDSALRDVVDGEIVNGN